MPTGNSKGAKSSRAAISQTVTKRRAQQRRGGNQHPVIGAHQSAEQYAAPASPTKLKSPAKLTAAPASSAAARMPRNRVRVTFSPSPVALSSPRQRTFRSTARKSASSMPTTKYGKAAASIFMVTPESPPGEKARRTGHDFGPEQFQGIDSGRQHATDRQPRQNQRGTGKPRTPGQQVQPAWNMPAPPRKEANCIGAGLQPGPPPWPTGQKKPAPALTPMTLGLAMALFEYRLRAVPPRQARAAPE